mmetsp:Transcript_22350/g.63343  ORF Transcript_22350/g.63343 Transcript_22350/m.63343 type:complete len:115 (-) Transcript_22350:1031-1375(-)
MIRSKSNAPDATFIIADVFTTGIDRSSSYKEKARRNEAEPAKKRTVAVAVMRVDAALVGAVVASSADGAATGLAVGAAVVDVGGIVGTDDGEAEGFIVAVKSKHGDELTTNGAS